MLSSLSNNSIQNILFTKKNSLLNKSALVIIGSIILAIASQISIPIEPVPITLQTATVLFIGMIYGWYLGGCTVVLYLLEGAIGLPVFAGFSSGLPILLGPTGGYLFGFIPAAIAVGFFAEKGWAKNGFRVFLTGVIGLLIIFSCGLIVLANFLGMQNAILYGLKPFLFIDIVKLIFLSFLVPKFWHNQHSN